MTGRIFIKPALNALGQALKVRKLEGDGHLAPEGEWVNHCSYWHRQFSDGSVEFATPPDSTAADPAGNPATSNKKK